jgi:hypothetical protein
MRVITFIPDLFNRGAVLIECGGAYEEKLAASQRRLRVLLQLFEVLRVIRVVKFIRIRLSGY